MITISNLVLIHPEEAKRISERIVERKNEMDSATSSVEGSLENLKTIVKCDGITETMSNLSMGIISNAKKVNDLYDKLTIFINEQTALYKENNANTTTQTTTINATLDEIK